MALLFSARCLPVDNRLLKHLGNHGFDCDDHQPHEPEQGGRVIGTCLALLQGVAANSVPWHQFANLIAGPDDPQNSALAD